MPKNKRKPGRKKRRKLTPEARASKRFKNQIRACFVNAGFTPIPTRERELSVAGRNGDLDSVFVFENVVVLVEDTTTKAENLKAHLLKTDSFLRHVESQNDTLCDVLIAQFPQFKAHYDAAGHQWSEYVLCFVYCSLHTVAATYQTRHNDLLTFLDYAQLQYFLSLSKSVRRTMRHELLSFLEVALTDIGSERAVEMREYAGLQLPSAPSGFPPDHKLVTFLVDPAMLLEQAYVLRADSWRDSECLYQRLLVKSKIANMRDYLAGIGRVYINNIIVTLPEDTKLISTPHGRRRAGDRIQPVRIQLPRRYNSIGIVDGQHRLYSYHEGADVHEARIAKLRPKQHLLVTGIVYPAGVTDARKQRFEAELFLEINDKQKKVQPDLRQAIKLIVEPYSPIAIGKAVIHLLGSRGPLDGLLERHFYDAGKIKTASIVSYGLKHIVGLHAEHSFFKLWRGPDKKLLSQSKSKETLDRYVDYCAGQLELLISGFKSALPKHMWTEDKNVSRVLTTTTINGLVFCMRRLIEHNALGDYEYYSRQFKSMRVDFRPDKFKYKSSHWKDLGEKLYAECFQ
jgi:DGQHR domain-containing protein